MQNNTADGKRSNRDFKESIQVLQSQRNQYCESKYP